MSELRIPHRDRSDPVSSVGELARHLESPDEAATVRALVTDAAGAGSTTVGDLLDRLGALDPRERRALVDRAQHAAGVPSKAAADSWAAHRERDRILSAAADDVELRFAFGPAGWVDVDALELERAQSLAEDERRCQAHEQRRAARIAEAPEVEREAAAEALAWVGANVMKPEGAA
jgi:hypothetical protein